MDSVDGNRRLDKQEFYWGLKDLGTEVTKRESELLLEYLDTNQDGFVDYNEFLVGVRGQPNAERQSFIDKAFQKFDSDNNGTISASDLAVVYDCSSHPKVQSGERSADEVFTEFLACFGDKNRDGLITKNEWNDYYAAVSSNIDSDEHFCALMARAWGL